MNYPLSREIYEHKPWMVDRTTFSVLSNMLLDFRNGVKFDGASSKSNSTHLYSIKSDAKIVTDTYQLNSEYSDDLVYVINLNGPIIKNGGMSTWGVKDLIQQMQTFQADNRIKGGVIMADSGGGSQLAMELMQYAVRNRTKPVVALVERSGVAASAAYGIISECDWIMAESELSQVGSIGTMISFKAAPNRSVDGNGEKQVTIYASTSTRKNLWFEEALNNDNYKLAIDEVLDPANERFRAGIREVRTKVLESQLDGSVYNAGDVIGTLVDQIGDFKQAVNKVIELSNSPKYSKSKQENNKNKKSTAMTAQELQQQHPEVHQSILSAGHTAGVKSEKERVKSWMTYQSVDPDAVKKGIESGEEITSSVREELLLKSSQSNMLKIIRTDSAPDLVTPESESEGKQLTADDIAFEKIYGKHNIKLN
ncbi:MAG TPA: S49 family peptidase [Pedobacter sp.]|uniref:S49 family peptidase n=1 Tax=Pedobacter sp. TaxID=1411316 RepID=UPI002BDB6C92|nr:S49 family peptidase [Pedobacter sp.]HMI01623.1 S49 family peptidase [Pedobacter sp.]